MRSSSVSINREEKTVMDRVQGTSNLEVTETRTNWRHTHRVGAASEVGEKGEWCPGIK